MASVPGDTVLAAGDCVATTPPDPAEDPVNSTLSILAFVSASCAWWIVSPTTDGIVIVLVLKPRTFGALVACNGGDEYHDASAADLAVGVGVAVQAGANRIPAAPAGHR